MRAGWSPKFTGPGFVAVLNSHSPPLTGNSARRAGSNSPPRSGLRSELRRGPGPGSVHSSFVRFEGSSPGGGDVREIQFSVTWIFAALHWSYVSYFGAAVLPLV